MEKKFSRENNCAFFQVQDRDWAVGWNLPEWIYAFNLRKSDRYGTVVRNGHWFILECSRIKKNSGEKWKKTFLEKILVKNGENSGEKWRKTFLEKILVKNGENFI